MKKQRNKSFLTSKDYNMVINQLSTVLKPLDRLAKIFKNGGNTIFLLFALMAALYSPTASAQTCASYTSGRAYVNASATGANNGTSWTDAYTTLQGALTLAASCPGVTQVWVAAGTYLPTTTSINMSPAYPRHLAFNMRNGLAIYGGFNGTETLLSQRNFISNVTTLSGDIGIPGNSGDNCVHVITNYSLNSTAVLDGFTISGGNANTGDPYVTNQFGGGMYNEQSSPTVSNCIFTGNAAATFGGGMDNEFCSPAAVVTNCTFTGNSANFGGGMNNSGSNTSITNCTFSLNSANSSGGGLYNQSGSTAVLSKCTFKQNTANSLGGGVYNLNSTPGLSNCIFIGNTANSGGGGMFNQLGSSAITNCSFSGNTGTPGGALNSISGTPALKNCILWGNSSGISGSPVVSNSIVQGSGVYAGTGNLNADPLFVSATDLHLQAGSPAINAGNNTGAPTTDIEGTARPLTVANPADMGAYEYVLLPPTISTYANTTVISGQNTTITPASAPTNAANAVAYTNTRFTGILSVNPTTGVVTVTDAKQAGTYTVIVNASNSAGSATTTFTLTVTNPTCSGGLFGTATIFAGGSGTYSMIPGDFNGDGKQDLAVTNTIANTISIYLGTGTGGFGAATNFTVGTAPFSIAVGDFNEDGKQDLAVSNFSSNNISILLGTGTGSFSAATNYALLSSASSVVIGDFNGDGHQDFAAANYNSGSVGIFPGTGTGNFGAPTNFSIGTFPNSLAIGDFNGDGKQDLAAANIVSNTVSVCLGTGTGSFGVPTAFAVGTNPIHVAIGDFNGDGKQDFAAANFSFSSNSVSIGLGTGTGSFGTVNNYPTGGQPNSVSIGDFNGDGKQDLAIPNYFTNDLSILIGTGTGSFGAATNYPQGTNARFAAIGDFNGDNRLDIAVTNDGSNNIFVHLSVANEINVQGGSPLVSIVDGDATPVATDSTAYGNVVVGNNLVHGFKIQNTGTAALTVSSISLSGADAGMFAVGPLSPALPIAAGGSATFNVTFAPTSTGLKTATVHIANNDCDEADYDFAIQGTGTCTPVTWYLDADNDTHYVSTTSSCNSPGLGYNTTGGTLGDCNDNNNAVWQSASLYIDVDGDGYDSGTQVVCYGATIPTGYNATTLGNDCKDNDASVHVVQTWYLDADNDTHYVSSVPSCVNPGTGYNTTGGTFGDCDDSNNTIWQSASLYVDADVDGYDAGSQLVCYGATIPSGYSATTNGSDCNDNDNTKWQSASLYIDGDGDGYDAGSAPVCYGSIIPSGYSQTTNGSDCDDNNSLAHAIQTWYLDADGDTHYVSSVPSCGSPGAGYNTTGGTSGDCDDTNNTIWQSASLYVDADADGYDGGSSNVCYGAMIPSGYSATTNGDDCNDNDNTKWQSTSLYIDGDGDGYDAGSAPVCYGSIIPSGYSAITNGSDCDDNNSLAHAVQTWYLDGDGDTHYVNSIPSCGSPGVGYNTTGGTSGDCDDTNNSNWQSASLYIDADGDGYDGGSANVCYGAMIPSGYSATTNGSDCNDNNSLAHAVQTWYLDTDNDTHYINSIPSCGSPGVGYNTAGGTSGDCDDTNNTIWQSASLYVDADADGYDGGSANVCYGAMIPSGYSATTNGSDCNDNNSLAHAVQTWYLDTDNDTHYVNSIPSCGSPGVGYNTTGGTSDDCNDNDNMKWQSASLYIDADADGYDGGSANVCYGANIPSGYSATTNGSDCNDNNSLAHAVQTWYLDTDNDTHYVNNIPSCGSPGVGYNTTGGTSGDCNDNDNMKWQSASLYIDGDADGYNAGSANVCYGATIPSGYSATTIGIDCNDANAAVHPGVAEVCNNTIDDNCNGQVDEGCCTSLTATATTTNPLIFYGYTLDQKSPISVTSTGGTGPKTYLWTMSRGLNCNVINSAGDESLSDGWNKTCTCTGSGCATAAGTYTGTSFSATLTSDADFTVVVTDANQCTASSTVHIDAIDARCFAGNSGIVKVQMCHHTGSAKNPYVTLCVDQSAVADLLALGDCIGPCTAYQNPLTCSGYKTEDSSLSGTGTLVTLSVYPNPSSGHFMIDFAGKAQPLTITVVNLLGQIMYTESINDFNGAIQKELDLSTLSAGSYLLYLRNDNQVRKQQIVITK